MAPKQKQAPAPSAEEIEKVLKPLKKLRTSMGSKAAEKRTLAEVGMQEGVTKEVVAMDRQAVSNEIERLVMEAALSILRGEGFSYTMPSRASSNMIYVPEVS